MESSGDPKKSSHLDKLEIAYKEWLQSLEIWQLPYGLIFLPDMNIGTCKVSVSNIEKGGWIKN